MNFDADDNKFYDRENVLLEQEVNGRYGLWLNSVRRERDGSMFDKAFVREINYGDGSASMVKPAGDIGVTLGPELEPYAEKIYAPVFADLTKKNGEFNISLNPPPPGGMALRMYVDANDPIWQTYPNAGALMIPISSNRAGETTEAKIIFHSMKAALWILLNHHELGHALGLGHTTSAGIMNATTLAKRWTDAELRNFVNRRHRFAGNMYLDNALRSSGLPVGLGALAAASSKTQSGLPDGVPVFACGSF
jgi:hypothetical protein